MSLASFGRFSALHLYITPLACWDESACPPLSMFLFHPSKLRPRYHALRDEGGVTGDMDKDDKSASVRWSSWRCTLT